MKKLLLLFICLLAMGISSASAAENYAITFNNDAKTATLIETGNNASTFITSDATAYVAAKPVKEVSTVYYGDTDKSAIRFGKSGGVGNITLLLSDAGKVKATSIVVTAKLYSSSEKATDLTVCGETQNVSATDYTDYTFNLDESLITEISLATTKSDSEKKHRVYVKKIVVNYDGEGGGDEPTALTLSGKYGENAIADGAVVTVDKGTEFTFTASEAALFTLNKEVLNTEAATTATWTANEVCAGKEMTLTAAAGEKTARLAFTLTVNEAVTPPTPPAGESITATWTFTGVATTAASGEKVDTDLNKTDDSANGTWHAVAEDSYANNINGAPQLGSANKPFLGTIRLSGSDIPENAVIGEIALTARTSKNKNITVKVSINKVDADGTFGFTTNTPSVSTLKNINLKGNEVVFTVTNATAYFNLSGISITYSLPPEMPEYVYDETAQVVELTCKDGHKLWVAEEDAPLEETEEAGEVVRTFAPMAAEAGSDHLWVKANNGDTSHKIDITTLTADKLVFAKAVHNESGNESDVLFIRIKPDGTISGVEGVAIDAAAGEDVYYDLQGRRVTAPAAGGFYVRVNGGKAEKVVIR